MLIFIGTKKSCDLNYQYDLILSKLSHFFEITTKVEEADIIVFPDSCCCTEYNLRCNLGYIVSILKRKKQSAKTYLTGCISRAFKEHSFLSKVEEYLKSNIDFIVPQNQPNLLLKLISEEAFKKERINAFGMVSEGINNSATMYISNGCLNNCSFCKVTFQQYPLKSVELNEIKEAIDYIDEKKIEKLILIGTNICQYGLDLYKKYMLPEILSYSEKKRNIKKINLTGFAFKDAIQNDFQSVLATSEKKITIGGSLESGSDRILKTNAKRIYQ